MSDEIRIRASNQSDDEFILSLVPRLAAFGPPPWRDATEMTSRDHMVIAEELREHPPGTVMFVAEDSAGNRLGFIHLEPRTDYYNPTEHAHIANLVVAAHGEGRGIGAALLEQAEKWARDRGYSWVTLTVFAQNERARAVYERAGYGQDMVKYVKVLT